MDVNGSNVKYNEENDYIQVLYNDEWVNTIFAGVHSLFIFKPNTGLIYPIVNGEGTSSSSDKNYLTLNINSGWISGWVFNINLSNYLNKGKKIVFEYTKNTSNTFHLESISSLTASASNSCYGNAYNIPTSSTLNRLEIPLDSLITKTLPYLAIHNHSYNSNQTTYSMKIYDLHLEDI